ncbi:NUDIX domain-containing protein [Arthrobacter sp. Hor0625]|uniref:NUDIX domain-containing protein n=1 Tax=Arthrobacter sp. Hor0625 TaxID=3457358 RepID=UPI00403E5C53
MADQRAIDAASRDVLGAHIAEEGLLEWFGTKWPSDPQPLAADVWAFTPDFTRILVVEHRWRGLVPPGGRVEPGETPREAAVRELREETGLDPAIAHRPAFAAARSYCRDWPETLNLSYWAVADATSELRPEPGQPARWADVDTDWRTFHRLDAGVIAGFAAAQQRRLSLTSREPGTSSAG